MGSAVNFCNGINSNCFTKCTVNVPFEKNDSLEKNDGPSPNNLIKSTGTSNLVKFSNKNTGESFGKFKSGLSPVLFPGKKRKSFCFISHYNNILPGIVTVKPNKKNKKDW